MSKENISNYQPNGTGMLPTEDPNSHTVKVDFLTLDVQISNFLLGEVLTIIDASLTNEQQCKAVKDLIKTQFRRKVQWIYELSTNHNGLSQVDIVTPTREFVE